MQTSLPDISEVIPISEADKVCFDEMIAVLKKHNSLSRFGITLLHQHFDITDDEILVESTDVKNRIQTIRPIKIEEFKNIPYTETSWRLDSGQPVTACICVKFGDDHQHLSRG